MHSAEIVPDVEGSVPESTVPDPADVHSSTDSGKQINTLFHGGFILGYVTVPLRAPPPFSHHVIAAIIHLRANRISIPVVVTANCSRAMLQIMQDLALLTIYSIFSSGVY